MSDHIFVVCSRETPSLERAFVFCSNVQQLCYLVSTILKTGKSFHGHGLFMPSADDLVIMPDSTKDNAVKIVLFGKQQLSPDVTVLELEARKTTFRDTFCGQMENPKL